MRMRILVQLIVGIWCGATVAAAGEPQNPQAARETVKVKNFSFSPVTLRVHPGATITWKNLDGEPHVMVSETGVFRSGALDEGDSFQFTFEKPGTYAFFCSVHPHMRGTIVVE